MNRRHFWLIAFILAALTGAWMFARSRMSGTIDYRGEKIKLTKLYVGYDDYKDDPQNIDPSENARVERLVTQAPMPRRFKDLKEAASAVFEVRFPGYASGSFGGWKTDGDAILSGLAVEIPRAGKTRYFVFRCAAGGCALLDDFVFAEPAGLSDFERAGPELVYTTVTGRRKFRRPIMR